MSSLVRRPNGHRWITYKFNGKRHTLRLGKVDDEIAMHVKGKVDLLVECVGTGTLIPVDVAIWLSRIDEKYHKALVVAGLSDARGPSTLGELIEAHEQSLIARGSKPSTLVNNRVVYANLLDYFKAKARISTITLQNAEQFKLRLVTKGGKGDKPLARATVSNRCRRARSIFAYALKNNWIPGPNPFLSVTTGHEWNTARDAYILPEIFAKILDASADHELRLLLALVRYCGLRCPSEVRPLTWANVDWTGNVLVVHSSKTELYGDGGRREVPLFPRVMPYLLAAAERRGDSELMFPNHQTTGAAITGRLASLCRKAGEVLWPKAMVNLRASAECDAMNDNSDIYTVAAWFGHSPVIALRHYSRVVKEQKARSAYRALQVETLTSVGNHEAKRHSGPQRSAAD